VESAVSEMQSEINILKEKVSQVIGNGTSEGGGDGQIPQLPERIENHISNLVGNDQLNPAANGGVAQNRSLGDINLSGERLQSLFN
jgi:hypothetical protein